MSEGRCFTCNKTKLLRKDGMVPIHGKCEGGGKGPRHEYFEPRLTDEVQDHILTQLEDLKAKGYTDADLEEMMSDLTPKRQKLRERLSVRWHNFKRKFDDMLDVFDD